MGCNLFLTEMNGTKISSADVKGKVITVTEISKREKGEAGRKKNREGINKKKGLGEIK